MDVRLGCTGWSYPGWVGPFYKPGTSPDGWLRAYARAFRLVEVNSSYHQAPTREQVASWARAAPAGFQFTLKVPRAITEARLEDVDDDLVGFLRALDPLREAGKLGPIALVMEPSFRRDKHEKALHAFLASWPRERALAVELRHASWWAEETYAALRKAGAALVWSDTQYGRSPPVLTAGWGYARLVGDRGLDDIPGFRWDRTVRDRSALLQHWAQEILRVAQSVRPFYVIANNHIEGHAPTSLAALARFLRIEPPDASAAAREPGQARL